MTVFLCFSYLQTDFKCKNSSKKIIRNAKIKVSKAVLVHRVLRSQGDAGDENDEHDEESIEVLKVNIHTDIKENSDMI